MIHSCRQVGSLNRASHILYKVNQILFHTSHKHLCLSQISPSVSPKQENFSGCFHSASAFRSFRVSESGADAQLLGKFSDCSSLIRGKKNFVNLSRQLGLRSLIHATDVKEAENDRTSQLMDFLRRHPGEEGAAGFRGSPFDPYNNKAEEKLDIVHIKMIKNNTFVTITDSKGNKKAGASSGCLEEMKGGPKLSRYAAEATAQHVGRVARKLGLKSVVMRVNGFTHFKKKKQAILSWKEGFTHGLGDRNPVEYIEDTTRIPHNGCRLPKKRRI